MKTSSKLIFGFAILIVGILVGLFSMHLWANAEVSNLMNHEALHQNMQTAEHSMQMNDNSSSDTVPSMPGQEAFGTIQKIMNILDHDPNTDWSKVNIPALRQHLIDMNELTMNSKVESKTIPGGLDLIVTGEGRTLEAIQRMVPTHVNMTLSKLDKWHVTYKKLENGIELTATAKDPKEIDHIRALGFIGLMATGADHPRHHLMMAKGEMHMN